LFAVSLAPWWIGGTGLIYGIAALVLSGLFVALALPVALRRAGANDSGADKMKPEKRLFSYSVLYLFALFTALVADRMILGQGTLA
jgi:heme o synthase